MKITMVSNYINHHQIPFCEEMIGLGYDFAFIQTQKIEEERLQMGWGDALPEYVIEAYKDAETDRRCRELIMDSDVVLAGWVEDTSYVLPRMKAGRFTFRVSERLYKTGQWKFISPRGLAAKKAEHTGYDRSPEYLLCAGAYVASDFGLFGAYNHRMFKWGYFPELRKYADANPAYSKTKNAGRHVDVLWAGRFIDWKHPEMALEAAGALKRNGIDYTLRIAGAGEMEGQLRQMVTAARLSEHVVFEGSKSPAEVRQLMEESDIFISTSDRNEGWGAVINEAMNSGCAVIASADAGAAPYLIKNGQNGLLYRSGDTESFMNQVVGMARYVDLRRSLGEKAYETIRYEWSPSVAAVRLSVVIKDLMALWGIKEGARGEPGQVPKEEYVSPYEWGPMSAEARRTERVVRNNALLGKDHEDK